MDFNNKDMEKMARMAQEMKGKSEDQVIQDLANLIKSGQGGMTPQKAQQMIQAISPMLDAAQRRKLEKLSRELNG